jgi:hypothetical protein
VRLVRRSPKIAAGFKVRACFFFHRASFNNSPTQKFIKKVGDKFKSFKEKVKNGFEKARMWIKDTGAKVVKFGAKIYATAVEAVGKVTNFVPGLGRAVLAVTNGVSCLANFVSDRINVKLSAKLQKGVNVMNGIQDPFGEWMWAFAFYFHVALFMLGVALTCLVFL